MKGIVVFTSRTDGNEAIKLSRLHSGFLYSTVGFHPGSLSQNMKKKAVKEIPTMLEYLKKPEVVAIGPTGFDLSNQKGDKSVQEEWFIMQSKVALYNKVPLIVIGDQCNIIFSAWDKAVEGTFVLHC